MNPKIQKLRSERAKHKAKISELQDRVRDLDKQILELENVEIIGMVRDRGFTLEQFMELLAGVQNPPTPDRTQTEDADAQT